MSSPTSARTPSAPPARAPLASLVASLVALAFVALAVVAVRDLAVDQGWTGGTAWTLPAVEALDGLSAGTAALVTGIVAGVLALVLLYVTLKPARRTHLAAEGGADLWVTPGAVAALAREAADRASDVRGAEARATKRKVTVTATVAPGATGVEQAVTREVEQVLAGLATQTVKVRTRTQEASR